MNDDDRGLLSARFRLSLIHVGQNGCNFNAERADKPGLEISFRNYASKCISISADRYGYN